MPDKPPTIRAAFAQAVENLRLGYPVGHDLYLSRLQPAAWTNGVLTLQAPNQAVHDICALRLNRLLTEEMRLVTGRDIALRYTIADGAPC